MGPMVTLAYSNVILEPDHIRELSYSIGDPISELKGLHEEGACLAYSHLLEYNGANKDTHGMSPPPMVKIVVYTQ